MANKMRDEKKMIRENLSRAKEVRKRRLFELNTMTEREKVELEIGETKSRIFNVKMDLDRKEFQGNLIMTDKLKNLESRLVILETKLKDMPADVIPEQPIQEVIANEHTQCA